MAQRSQIEEWIPPAEVEEWTPSVEVPLKREEKKVHPLLKGGIADPNLDWKQRASNLAFGNPNIGTVTGMDDSILPEWKKEPETYWGGVGKSLYSDFIRPLASPSGIIGSVGKIGKIGKVIPKERLALPPSKESRFLSGEEGLKDLHVGAPKEVSATYKPKVERFSNTSSERLNPVSENLLIDVLSPPEPNAWEALKKIEKPQNLTTESKIFDPKILFPKKEVAPIGEVKPLEVAPIKKERASTLVPRIAKRVSDVSNKLRGEGKTVLSSDIKGVSWINETTGEKGFEPIKWAHDPNWIGKPVLPNEMKALDKFGIKGEDIGEPLKEPYTPQVTKSKMGIEGIGKVELDKYGQPKFGNKYEVAPNANEIALQEAKIQPKALLAKKEFSGKAGLPIETSDEAIPKIDRRISNLDYGGPERRSLVEPAAESSIKSPLERLKGEKGELNIGPIAPYIESEIGKIKSFPGEVKRAIKEEGYLSTIGNTSRSMMAGSDLSAPLRQGATLIHKKEFWSNLKPMVEMFTNEGKYAKEMAAIKSSPSYEFKTKSGLQLTGLNTGPEERFLTTLAEQVPLTGRITRASDRAYTGFLNKLRSDTFDSLIDDAAKSGVKIDGNLSKQIAKYVNVATGRGDLLEKLEPNARFLNAVFFSPRLMSSRMTLLNPKYYVNADPFVRKEALKSMFALSSAVMTIGGLAKVSGAEFSMNPTSPDFAKIKVGNTRVDLGAGFLQYLVASSKLLTGKSTSSTSGKVTRLGKGYKPQTRKDVIYRFFESKEAPLMSFITTMLEGKDYRGQELNIPKEVVDRYTPMILQDLRDLIKEDPKRFPLIIPGVFGASVQTYGRGNPNKIVPNKEEIPEWIPPK